MGRVCVCVCGVDVWRGVHVCNMHVLGLALQGRRCTQMNAVVYTHAHMHRERERERVMLWCTEVREGSSVYDNMVNETAQDAPDDEVHTHTHMRAHTRTHIR